MPTSDHDHIRRPSELTDTDTCVKEAREAGSRKKYKASETLSFAQCQDLNMQGMLKKG